MKLSIIIPVFNVEKYVSKCIESVLLQDIVNYEIIIVDDDSNDNSGKICQKYAKMNKNINYFHKSNGGLSDARNFGINHARGEYLVFLDSDDKLASKNSLRLLLESAKESNDPDIIISERIDYDEQQGKVLKKPYSLVKRPYNTNTEFYRYLIHIKGFLPSAWIVCINRKFLLNNNLFFLKGIFHEDEEWTPRVFLNCQSFAVNSNVLIEYRVNRAGSIINSYNIKKLFDKLIVINSLIIESTKKHYSVENKQIFLERSENILFGIIMELPKYYEDIKCYEIINELKEKMYISKFSKSYKHKIIYLLIEIFGIHSLIKIMKRS